MTSTLKATAWYRGDYEALSRDFDGRRAVRSVPPCLQWDDVLLTVIMGVGSIQELTFAVFRLGYPEWTLETVSQFNATSITPPMVRLTRVGGWSNLEGGILGLLLVVWRIVRWYTGLPFAGQNFQFGFALTTLSKTGAFLTNASLSGWRPFAADAPLDNIVLFARALVSLLSLLLSIRTYRSSWAFVWTNPM